MMATLTLLACADAGGPVVPHVDDDPGPSDPTPPSAALVAAELRLVSGDDQEGEVGQTLPSALTVQVTDSLGEPIAGAPVEWVFTHGGGRGAGQSGNATSSVVVQTDAGGMAAVEWQLGTSAGVQLADAGIVLPAGVTPLHAPSAAPKSGWGGWREIRARGRPGSVSSVTVSPDRVDGMVGDTARLLAIVADRYGNELESASVAWNSSDDAVAQVGPSGLVRFLSAGTSSVTAESSNRQGSATVTAEQATGPQAPVASITAPGNDTTIVVGSSVQFAGSASDADGSVVGHAWSFGDGGSSNQADPGAHTYTSEGTYDVSYVVTDDTGLESTPATVSVAVVAASNQLTTAVIDAPSNGTTVLVGEALQFLGSASDPDGSISRHRWTFGDGTSSAEEDPGNRSYGAPGTYWVTYRVWDDNNARSQVARVTVVVEADNAAPTASITSPASNLTVDVGEQIDFRGTAADSDGSIVRHEWSFGDGGTSSVGNPGLRSYGAAGTYSVTYQVWDDENAASAVARRTITVQQASNARPTGSIVSPASNVTIDEGGAVNFQGSASDPDGSVVSHLWNFGDGSSSTVEDPGMQTFTNAGTYQVQYTVTDDAGATSTPASRTITVRSSGPPPPPPGNIVWEANWDPGLGTGVNAFTDGGQFTMWGGGAESGGFEVKSTSAQGRDFTTPNYLQVAMVNNQDWIDMTSSNWATPQVGQTITASFEIRWTSNVGGQTTHGFYFDDDFGGENWGPQTLGLSIEDNANNWQMMVWTGGNPFRGGFRPQQRMALSKTQTYQVSLSYTRTGTNEYRAGIEIRTIDGTLLYDSSDYGDYEWYSGSNTLSNTVFTQSNAGAQGMRGFRVGNNGLDVKQMANQQIVEIANLQVRMGG